MITDTYIKQCEMAEEIQKEWSCKKGDWLVNFILKNLLSVGPCKSYTISHGLAKNGRRLNEKD